MNAPAATPAASALLLIRRHGLEGLVFLASFGLSKATAFFGPLVLAALLPASVFGAIELALSAGLVLAVALSAGVAGSVPQLTLLRRPVPVVDLLAVQTGATGALLGLVAFACVVSGQAAIAALIALAAAVTLAQFALSAQWRATSRRNLSTWVDNLGVLVATGIGGAIVVANRPDIGALVAVYGAAVAVGVVGCGVIAQRARAPDLRARFNRVMALGGPLALYTLAGVWIASSGRVLVGLVRPIEDVALFAYCARISLVIIVLHALLTTAFFVRIYRLRTRQFDRLGAIYFAGIAMFCACLMLAAPYVLPRIPTRAVRPDDMAKAIEVFRILAVFAFAWGVCGQLDMRINRCRLAGPAAWRNGLIALAIVLVFLVARATTGLELAQAAWLVAGQMVAVVAAQLWTLWQRRLAMPRVTLVAGAGVLALAGLAAGLSA